MPRKRKDDFMLSDRHIRRLAQNLTEQDLQNTISGSSNLNIGGEVPATENVTSALKKQHIVNTERSHDLFKDVTFEQSNVNDYAVVSNSEECYNDDKQDNKVASISNLKELDIEYNNDNDEDLCEKDHTDLSDLSENLSDMCDTDSIDCDVYRYSDSDADSIGSNDEMFADFDIDTVFENLDPSKDDQFHYDIAVWARDFNINHNALRVLLSILNKYTETQFCKDPRTLLKTPKSTYIIDMDEGKYCHLGVISFIEKNIKDKIAINKVSNTINLLVNIDGAPIVGNSSEKGLWVILCKEYELQNVHVIGIYHGVKKPENHNIFLQMFVDELTYLINSGFTYEKKTYNVRLYGLICDAPAKSFILCTKYHSGYNSCSKCEITGTYYSSVCFPLANEFQFRKYCNFDLRTDTKFKTLQYIDKYQRGETILSKLPHFGLVSNVPLDSMHLVYLGIMKQMIRHWVGDKNQNKNYKLSDEQTEVISRRLENLKNILPSEFNRRSRSIIYWKQWKATEFRHFLLYFGPFVLKDVVKREIYDNFLQLHISILILSNNMLVLKSENVHYAESMIIEFISNFQNIYGLRNVTFNIHSLLHLPKDVQKYGSLDMFDAFPFENYICSLKKMIRKGDKPLQQIAKRLAEHERIKRFKLKCGIDSKYFVEKIHYGGLVPDNFSYDFQYKILKKGSCVLDINDDKNNCIILKNGSTVNVLNIVKKGEDIFIIGKKIDKIKNLYDIAGVNSDLFGIKITKELNEIEVCPCNMINCKVFKIPTSRGLVIFPIIHTFRMFNE